MLKHQVVLTKTVWSVWIFILSFIMCSIEQRKSHRFGMMTEFLFVELTNPLKQMKSVGQHITVIHNDNNNNKNFFQKFSFVAVMSPRPVFNSHSKLIS